MASLTGRTLGRYRLEGLVGRGGMAEVYRATDTKLARSVAVKVLHATHAADEQFLERFLREARLVASLEHPNILPIYDFGEEEGIPFLVMPYMDGGTLRDRMRGRPYTLAEVVPWIQQLADALDTAHDASILHRDVKPANVLVGKGNRLVLSDFGIAKIMESTTGLTATGMVVGTPIYMAPEQAQGKPASPATDRYSLAILAYELLAGEPPFTGESALSLMHQHVATKAPSITTKLEGLPPGLDQVFESALAKEPERRPPSCHALADNLFACLPPGALPLAGPTIPWASIARDADDATAPTVHDARTPSGARAAGGQAPPALANRSLRPVSMTSEATITARRESLALAKYKMPITAAALLVAAVAVVLWQKPRQAEPEKAAQPEPAPIAATTDATTELGSLPAPPATAVPLRSVQGEQDLRPTTRPARDPHDAARLKVLTAALEDALAKGRLAPPDERSALESLASLRREFPSALELAVMEKRVADALKVKGSRTLSAGKTTEARTYFVQAQALRPSDAEIAALLAATDKLIAETGAVVPPAPPPPVGGIAPAPDVPEMPAALSRDLAAVRSNIDPLRRTGRLTKKDFDTALETSRAVLEKQPHRKDARTIQTYASGGLAYIAGRDDDASAAILEVASALKFVASPETRSLSMILRSLDGRSPAAWELALAYGDARNEADKLLAKELESRPSDARMLMARASIRRMEGKSAEAIADARRAYEIVPKQKSSGIAEFLGDEEEAAGKHEDAVTWYQAAVTASRGEAGIAALKAGRILRDSLRRPAEATEMFRVACVSTRNVEACIEAGIQGRREKVLRRRAGGG